jgi:hypothetical protein
MGDLIRMIADRRDLHELPDLTVVLAWGAQFAPPFAPFLHCLEKAIVVSIGRKPRPQHRDLLFENLLKRVARNLGEPGIDVLHPSIRHRNDHRQRRLLHRIGQFVIVLLRQPTFGHIPPNGAKTNQVSLIVPQGVFLPRQPTPALGGQPSVLVSHTIRCV